MNSIQSFPINKVRAGCAEAASDLVAVEEPLEIRLEYIDRLGRQKCKSLAVTMRTPGDDFDLAAGFLFTEGILRCFQDVREIRRCHPPRKNKSSNNLVLVELAGGIVPDLEKLERNFYATSSCGVCGKSSIEAIRLESAYAGLIPSNTLTISSEVIKALPEALLGAQKGFGATGGLHAAGLFSPTGSALCVREDIGRHNAVDKVIGASLRLGRVPLTDSLLMVSSRASFELVQKAAMAGIPLLAAVGAPSSLAIELAREFSMTLLGFVRDGRFNIYHGEGRLAILQQDYGVVCL